MDFSQHKDKIKIKINRISIGAITYYGAEYCKKPTGFESSTADEYYYILTLKRRMGFDFSRELLDFYKSPDFEISVTRGERTKTYTFGKLISIVEETGEDKLLYQTLKFSFELASVTAAETEA